MTLATSKVLTRQNNYIPFKLNILLWGVALNWSPTRAKLVDVEYTFCPLCDLALEIVSRLFVLCSMIVDIWHLIGKWWDI